MAVKVAPREIEEFVYQEARMLDERRFEEWLELFTEDGYVWAPARLGQEDWTKEVSLVRDDRELLEVRIRRLRHPAIHSQLPPAQAARLVSNVAVDDEDEVSGEVTVHSTFIMIEARLGEQRIFGGHYEHRLRRNGNGWRIAAKKVQLVNPDATFFNLGLPF